MKPLLVLSGSPQEKKIHFHLWTLDCKHCLDSWYIDNANSWWLVYGSRLGTLRKTFTMKISSTAQAIIDEWEKPHEVILCDQCNKRQGECQCEPNPGLNCLGCNKILPYHYCDNPNCRNYEGD